MQREMDKLSASIDLLKSQLAKIATIDVHKSSAKVCFGSYLITDAGHYFMSIGLGKSQIHMVISLPYRVIHPSARN